MLKHNTFKKKSGRVPNFLSSQAHFSAKPRGKVSTNYTKAPDVALLSFISKRIA
jgi:hypothetical protein